MAMRVIAAFIFLSALSAAPAVAGSIEDCKTLADESAVGECLEQKFRTSERSLLQAAGVLERALEKIEALTIPEIDAPAKFRAAHEQWMSYRIRDCAFLTAMENWEDNSGRDILECLIATTDRRAERYSALADTLTQRHLE